MQLALHQAPELLVSTPRQQARQRGEDVFSQRM
jgi:hypothetical protein